MGKLEELWAGEFGDAYTKRNRVDWQKRIPFWKSIIDMTGARSVHEVGCNAGWNLSAIQRAYPDVRVAGNDVNAAALSQAEAAGLFTYEGPLSEWTTDGADLVFTCGVLIHISPEDLPQMMQDIVEASFDWVLAVEYWADVETEVPYRGQSGALWKRPYGRLYTDLGLRPMASGALKAEDGFDNCDWALLRK